jgi:hypothetical protein
MSYGTEGTFASKKAFAAYVDANGADNVYVLDTSMFITPDKRRVTVASLADTSAAIVGPDVERDRRWYANVKTKTNRTTKDTRVVIV